MKIKLIRKLGLIIFISFLSITCIGQNAYSFTSWKSKTQFDNKIIIFQIDTLCSRQESVLLLIVASKIDDNLTKKGITTKAIPFPSDTIIDSNTLCLKFELLKRAYVKLNPLESQIPLCFRDKVTQSQHQTQTKTKKIIESIISISIDKKQQGVDQMGVAFAEKLLKHFKIEEK